jgi:hypothetical protein
MDLKGWEKLGWPKFWRVANCVIFMSAKFQKIKKKIKIRFLSISFSPTQLNTGQMLLSQQFS